MAILEKVTNPRSLAYRLGMRRKIRMTGDQICWYFKKHQRATMRHRLFRHNLLKGW